MIEQVKKEVYTLMYKDETGHSNDHVNRVLDLTLKFASVENADQNIAALIALLHDVDDYKLVSEEEAQNLTNARRILDSVGASEKVKEHVLQELTRIGYSKSLEGIRPMTIEGKVVSDADMCDALGVNGFIRCYQYNVKHGGVLFDRNQFPLVNMSAQEYKKSNSNSAVNHIFEKLLKLKGLMLTKAGKKEASNRQDILERILYQLFDEESADDWKIYLNDYLNDLNSR